MAEVIAIANQKGGVAKTTTAHNIGMGLSMREKKTLLIDMDSQASLTICAGLEPTETAETSIVAVLTDEPGKHRDIKDCIHKIGVGEYISKTGFIVPSIIDLADLEWKMQARVSREKILSRALEPIQNDFDYIIIDCPPQLSILTLNALSCANGVIIPVKTDYLAYRGLTHLNDTISDVQELTNPDLKIYGVVATMYEKRVKNDTAILMELNRNHNLIGIINKKVMAGKGVYDGMAAVEYAPNADISQEYMRIVDLIISGKYEPVRGIEK